MFNISQAIKNSNNEYQHFDGKLKWQEKKAEAEIISDRLYQLPKAYHKRAGRICACAQHIQTRSCPDGHHHRVVRATLCRDRVCPVCGWLRSRATASKTAAAVGKAGGRYLHLVLTVPSPRDGHLRETLQRLTKSFGSLMRSPRLRGVVGGYARTVEITRTARGWHPHIHALLRVEESYFRSALYVSQEEWLNLWRECYGDQTITNLHISAVSADVVGYAIIETSKYISKPAVILELTIKQLTEYLAAVKGMRMWSSGGCLKITEQEPESDSELIHAADEEQVERCPICGAHLQPVDWQWRDKKYSPLCYALNWAMLQQKNKISRRGQNQKADHDGKQAC